jgi:hypothetical protein
VRRLQPAWSPLRPLPSCDQARSLQYLQVLGNGGERHLEGGGKLRDRRLPIREPSQDRPAGRVGEGRERSVQHIRGHFIQPFGYLTYR